MPDQNCPADSSASREKTELPVEDSSEEHNPEISVPVSEVLAASIS